MKSTIKKLEDLLPELRHGRGTHIEWRDCHQKYRDDNPDIGDSEFHAELVRVYDNRIETILEAIELLKEVGSDE